MGRASLELVWGEGSCTDVSLWREVLIHVYRIYLPELQRLSIITKCNIMFLKSIKHVHKLSPSGREKISEHMWGLHNYCFFTGGKMQACTKYYQIKKKNLMTFIQTFNLNENFFFINVTLNLMLSLQKYIKCIIIVRHWMIYMHFQTLISHRLCIHQIWNDSYYYFSSHASCQVNQTLWYIA